MRLALVLCALLALVGAGRSADDLLAAAEDEAEKEELTDEMRAQITARVAAAFGDDDADGTEWASRLTELRFSEGGVDDEVLPYIPVGASEAELKEAPAAKGMAVLSRKQRFAGLKVEVLENQVVLLSGMENAAERKARLAAGLGIENAYASALACRPVNGTAMFLLAYRRPVDGQPHLHEVTFFDAPLWSSFVEYMERARSDADIFGGASPWTMRIHWNVLPREQRVPWVATRPQLRTVAHPTLLPPSEQMA